MGHFTTETLRAAIVNVLRDHAPEIRGLGPLTGKLLDAISKMPPSATANSTGHTYSQAEYDDAYEIGKRDGYSEAVQQIDQLTGGDGEYRYCFGDEGNSRHTPGPAEMIQRIVDRFEVLNQLDEATRTGSDQPDDAQTPAPQLLGAPIDRERAAKAAVEANNAYGQWMPERWLNIFLDAYERAAAKEGQS